MAADALMLAWAAGLFEGEGSIGIQRDRRYGRVRVRFVMSTTDEDVMRRFHSIVGCGTVSGPTWHTMSKKGIWRWNASRPEEVARLESALRPYLGERRTLALDAALAAYANQAERRHHHRDKTHCPHGHPYSEANVRRNGGRRHCIACEKARSRSRSIEAGIST